MSPETGPRLGWPPPAPRRWLTRVDVFLVSPQGLLALQPLPAAVGLAHEPGLAPAGLLLLLATTGQGEAGEDTPAGADAVSRQASATHAPWGGAGVTRAFAGQVRRCRFRSQGQEGSRGA